MARQYLLGEKQHEWFKRLFGIITKQAQPLIARHRAVTLILYLAAPTALVFSWVNYAEGFVGLGLTQLAVCLLLLLPIFVLLKHERHVPVTEYLLMVAAVIIFSSLLIAGGIADTGIYWVGLYPFTAFYVMGQRRGWLWIAVFAAIILLVVVMDMNHQIVLPYNATELLYFSQSFAFYTLTAAVFNMLREDYEDALEIGVKERTSELLASREMIRESEQRFRSIFESVQDIYYRTDLNGRIVIVSPSCEEVTGYSPEELIGQDISSFYADPGQRDELIDLLMEHGKVNDLELNGLRKDGSTAIGSVTSQLVYDDKHQPIAVEGIIRDVSERKQAEELERKHLQELAHALRLNTMGEMASEIAHELNQPLTAIRSYSGACTHMVGNNNWKRDEMLEALANISKQSERAAKIIKQLRGFIRKGEVQRKSTVDMNDLIRDMVRLEDAGIRRYKVDLILDTADNMLQVICDRVLIGQVVLNLVHNAIEAMQSLAEDERRLFIRTTNHDNKAVLVSISDVGPGMSEQEIEKAFEAFHSTKPKGMGMGLPISKSIIEAHAGHLWAVPNEYGGTAFYFSLPVSGVSDVD